MYYDKAKNFSDITKVFAYWYSNQYAKILLTAMEFEVSRIKDIKMTPIIKNDNEGCIKFEVYDGCLKKIQYIGNLQIKLVSNKSGFNQIDKRWVETYQELWNIPNNVVKILKHFTGELSPYIKNMRDSRRMFIDELSKQDQRTLFDFLNDNKTLIINDILKGRGVFSAEWMLVIVKDKDPLRWALKSINEVLNFFGNGEIKISPKGSISIGKITMQRKGGDGGRPSANMLQFKINPTELLNY